MELIKINERKLKVSLSESDLKGYDLRPDNLDYDCPATKRAFKEILERAKEQTGFDTDEERIFVQIFPGLRGGCEMYVTRLCEEGEKVHTMRTVYTFDRLENLITACRGLCGYGFRDESALYFINGHFHLLLSEDYKQNNSTYSVGGRARTLPAYPLLCEYGKRTVSEKYVLYLREHGKLICDKNAVQVMGEL